MAKSETFRVVNGRIHFKCHACQSKRMVSVPPALRQRSIRCHKCSEITRANFNRRLILRESQRGKILITLRDSEPIEVDLYDMSINGIGFDVATKDIRKMAVGNEIALRCTWNPKLFRQGRYIIRSIKGRRIGAQSQHV